MILARTASLALFVALSLAGCQARRGEGNGGVPGDAESSKPFAAISSREALHFVGTEPFWGGQAQGGTLIYETPANPEGTKIAIERFAGRNGLGLSGKLDGKAFDMTVTPGTCSDGMSDRRYPFTVTLSLGGEVRQGCGWTDGKQFSEAKSD